MIQKTNKKIKIFHPVIITINLVLLLCLGNAASFSLAQSNPSQSNSNNSETNSSTDSAGSNSSNVDTNTAANQLSNLETKCITEINAFQDEKFQDYQKFMEEHFKNKSGTTYLLSDAVLKYEEYKKALFDQLTAFENQNNQNSGANQQLQFQFLSVCRDQVNKYVSDARKLLVMRAETTSGIKKATAILDKYKQLNAKLRELNLEFLKMKANLGTFSQKLPCYLRKQCNKG